MMTHRTLICLACLLAVAATCRSHASDGVIEINQACALNGCYSGDAPGFPVFIKEPGSYRLTGNLDLSAIPDTTAIQITSSFVTLDLNGFEIAGPKVCTGSGATLNCGGTDNGAGVLIEPDARAVTVRNGAVRNMGVEGIWGRSDALTIENVRAIHNARNGLRGETDSLVINSIAIENGDDGFDFGARTLARGNSAFGNGSRGYRLGPNSRFSTNVSGENAGTDACGGGICSEQKRYYLTQDEHLGTDALSACGAGFHMAAFLEIVDYSNLVYDTVLGLNYADNQTGPPQNNSQWGWVRTGEGSDFGDNCSNWTDAAGSAHKVRLIHVEFWDDNLLRPSPWWTESDACSDVNRVWCIED